MYFLLLSNLVLLSCQNEATVRRDILHIHSLRAKVCEIKKNLVGISLNTSMFDTPS